MKKVPPQDGADDGDAVMLSDEFSIANVLINFISPKHPPIRVLETMGKNVCKKKQNNDSEENPADRLSKLPDSVRKQVLTLLPIKEAVRTGVLSKRWKNLWTEMDKIDYRMKIPSFISLEKQRNFICFVDHTLMQCIDIKTFSISTMKFHEDNFQFLHSLFDKWLQWLYSHEVENLTVKIWKFSYTPSEWFYHNSNLVKLDISSWNFTNHTNPAPVVSWTLLKSLSLGNTAIGDELFANILSGCPVLENLDLYDVRFHSLNIMSPRLVKLSVTYHLMDLPKGSLEIKAPWLQFLNLCGHFHLGVVRLIDVFFLVHANLNFGIDENVRFDVATKLLESVRHVQELTIGQEFIPALTLMKLSRKPCPLFCNCKRLALIMSVYKHELPGITHLLQSSHHLETLAIEVQQYNEEKIRKHIKKRVDFEGLDFPNLKRIEITFCNCEIEPDLEGKKEYFVFELVSYILGKASVLEKLVIAPKKEACECSRNCVWDHASKLSHKLLKFLVDREEGGEWNLKIKENSYVEIIFLKC